MGWGWRSTWTACENGYQQVFGERIGVREHLPRATVSDLERFIAAVAREQELEAIFTGRQAARRREPILAPE